MLTGKQEKFVQGLITGLSQRKAYIAAYSTKNMSNNSIDVAASKLLNNPKVLLRHKKLMNEAKEKTIWSFQRATEELISILEEAREEKDKRSSIAAIKELNSLHGIEKTTDKITSVNVTIATNKRDNPEEREARVKAHLKREGVLN